MENRCALWIVVVLLESGFCGALFEMSGKEFDASEVTWAHAVNSRMMLNKELDGSADFLEADVSMGLVVGTQFGTLVPIMAHPPSVSSDLSLEMWLDRVASSRTGKGIKLDFKSLESVEPSLEILKKFSNRLNSTLWLNADILYGPILSTVPPVKDDAFLLQCSQNFPNAVLSIGWTTYFYSTFPRETWTYEWTHVRKMADVIRCFGYDKKLPRVTFPVRGVFMKRSIPQLRWLLSVVPESSLTVWSARFDPLEVEDLLLVRRAFPKHQVYYDVPDTLHSKFTEMKNATRFVANSTSAVSKDDWMTVSRGAGQSCQSYSYVGGDSIVFGKFVPTAALLKKPFVVDKSKSLIVQGRIKFFKDYDKDPDSVVQLDRNLSIALIDVSLIEKNSTHPNFDVSKGDSAVLWKALNESRLHTFRQSGLNSCSMFKLDSSADLSFQVWTIPCDDDSSALEVARQEGVQEISGRQRVVLPEAPFMFGFVSEGGSHVVVHDFEIRYEKEDIAASSLRSSALLLGAAKLMLAAACFMVLA